MYDEEIGMKNVIEGSIAIVADVYTRGVTLDGYSPWLLRWRVGANLNGEAWAWYWNTDTEDWKLDVKKHDNFVLLISELLGGGGPNQAKAEVAQYK